MSDTRRDFTEIGSEYRPHLDAAIKTLEWYETKDSPTLALIPGLGIQETIKQLRIPKVDRIAVGTIRSPKEMRRRGECSDVFGFYAIVGHYTNGRAQIYVADHGDAITPIAIDFQPA